MEQSQSADPAARLTEGFAEDGLSYTLIEKAPPRERTNVIAGTNGYLVEISQWGVGTSSFQFEDFEVNKVSRDKGKVLYLREEETKEVWTPGWYPMMSPVEEYSCIHEDRGTTVRSSHLDVEVEWRIMVAEGEPGERWQIALTNCGDLPRRISVIPALSLELKGFDAPRFFDEQVQYSTCEFDSELGGLYYDARNPNPRNWRYNAVLASADPVTSFTGSREEFYGAAEAYQYPELLYTSSTLGNQKGIAGEPFQALQCVAELGPGETRSFHFYFGVFESKQEAAGLLAAWREDPAGQIEAIRKAAKEKRSSLWLKTPDKRLDAFINLWLKKGLEYGMAKKDATRDNLQFAFGLTLADPDRVRRELLRVLPFQYADGHTVRSWVPMDTTYYCDGPLWLLLSVCKYLKVSGDMTFLQEEVAYFDGGSGTVREHLERGVARVDTDRGPHGLPLIRFADWNDALNIDHPEAESVFMAMGLALMLNEMAELMQALGEESAAQEYRCKHAGLKERVNESCWSDEGGYYIRAFAGDEVIGGPDSDGSTLFVNPQTWSIISGVVTEERLPAVLRVIDERVETSVGCPVNVPAFDHYIPRFGRVTAQIPGTWENGSSYCHVTAFKAYADTLIGRENQAYASINSIMPGSDENPLAASGALPYTLTSSYSTNPEIYGRAGRPWLTGTQAWVYTAVVEGLLGIQPAYGGLRIAPALPTGWEEASLRLRIRSTEYRFVFRRADRHRASEERQQAKIMVNGKPFEEDLLPFGVFGSDVDIEVVL